MPLESVAEWRARIGSSWCAVGRPFKSKSSRSGRPHRVLSQDQVETMMMILSISFIHWLLFDLPVLCLLDWQCVPNLLWKKTSQSGRFTLISGKRVLKRRRIVLIRCKIVTTTLESTSSMTSNLIGILLLKSGDVELNPGPGLNYDNVDSKKLVAGNLFDVVKELSPVESRFYNIGLALRLDMEYLEDIEDKYGQNPCRAMQKVVDAWLKQKYDVSTFGPPTWQNLVKVIDDPAGGNDHQLAEKIALDHPAEQPSKVRNEEGDSKLTDESDHTAGISQHSSEAKEDVEIQNEGDTPRSSSVKTKNEPLDQKLHSDFLGINDLKEVLDITWKYRAQWRAIGTELGINQGTLAAISKDERKVEDCLREMINKWLRHTDPMPTRSALTAALNSEHVSVNKLDGYTSYLKALYNRMMEVCYIDESNWPPPIIKRVFRLAMIMSEKLQRTKIADDFIRKTITGKVDDILRKKSPIKLEEVLEKVEVGRKKVVLMEGAPGCGKSTLSLHICQQWAEGKLLREYSQVVLVRLRDRAVHGAKNIVDLLPKEDESMGKELQKEIVNCRGKGVLFVLDGWDELPPQAPGRSVITDLLTLTKLPESSVIITSRPTSSANLHNLVKLRIEILGFTKDELKQYFALCLENKIENAEVLIKRIKENPVVAGSCSLPLNASILVHLFKVTDELPVTQFGIFSSLIRNCMYRHQKKIGKPVSAIKSLDKLPQEVEGPFKNICKIAYEGIMDDCIMFDLDRNFNTLGLLQGVESIADGGMSHSFNFLHLSIQELLAAIYMATELKPEKQVEQFRELFGRARFSSVFRFYSALTKLNTPGIDEVVVEAVEKCLSDRYVTEFTPNPDDNNVDSSDSDSDDSASSDSSSTRKPQPLLLSLLHCLYEAQDKSLCESVVKQFNEQKLNLNNISLNLADCVVVGFFLSHCRNFAVDLRGCGIGDEGCKTLFRPGAAYDLRILNLEGNSIGDEGAMAVSEAVKKMPNLLVLNLHLNYAISDVGRAALRDAWRQTGKAIWFDGMYDKRK